MGGKRTAGASPRVAGDPSGPGAPALPGSIPLTRWSARARARWAAESGFGFDAEELERLVGYYARLGRDPSPVEIAGIAQSWSEHCSYKSSRRWLRRYFSGLAQDRRVLGTG
ncbi:hypothetical protein B2A_14736, partial [mine drainage metagenome]